MNNIKNEVNYNEVVNPTFTTGQATLEMLAAAGNPDAVTYKEMLALNGATQKVSANSNGAAQIFSPEEGRALMMGVTLGIEARYAAVSRLLKESGYKSMLDIASGYTPRALMCKKEGIDYVGLDLPAVIEKMAPLAEKMDISEKHPTYVAGDATNADSIKAAADMLEGELFITCEGLLTYLNKSELEQTIQGIREILLEHGGAWYSSDMGVMYDHFSAVAINKPDVLERWAKIMSSIKKETDVYFFPVNFKTVEEKVAFFEDRGLHVEFVPFYTEDTRLNILYGFDAEGQERMKHLMKSFNIWKMTAAEEKTATTRQTANGLNIQYSYTKETLYVSLNGRLDTLSAPELMELMDELYEKEPFSELVLDLENLEYLSSTGLRVFLMMAKRLGSEHLFVDNSNALVREIFETTGFTEVVCVR
jgi:anti-anti-sigma factor